MKPGGYIEQFELSVEIKSDDGTVTDDGPLRKFNELCQVSKFLPCIPDMCYMTNTELHLKLD
jgi:hypothetical protein